MRLSPSHSPSLHRNFFVCRSLHWLRYQGTGSIFSYVENLHTLTLDISPSRYVIAVPAPESSCKTTAPESVRPFYTGNRSTGVVDPDVCRRGRLPALELPGSLPKSSCPGIIPAGVGKFLRSQKRLQKVHNIYDTKLRQSVL